MSYISKKGKAAAQSATEEKKDLSKVLVSLKSGTSYKVRVASDEDFVEYYAHSVFKKIVTTPCTRASGTPDLYDRAVDMLYSDAKKAEQAGDTAKSEELRQLAGQLRAKPRYLFAFINLADGNEMIVDVTKNQARSIIQAITKYAKKIDKLAFELSKEGQSTSTTVSLSPIIDEDDLSDTERKHFEASAGKTIDDELYEKVLYVKNEEEQIEDLRNIGFDVARLGVGEGVGSDEVQPVQDDNSDDYPF